MKQESLNVFCCCKKLVLILAMICGRVIDFLKISTFKVFKKELWTFVIGCWDRNSLLPVVVCQLQGGLPEHQNL